jgi:hypothetical protein
MSLLDLFRSDSSGRDDNPGTQSNDKACNISGHDWQSAYSSDYYARSKTFKDNVLRVKKKTHEKCRKCSNYQNNREWIGKVKIDKETDELTVIE